MTTRTISNPKRGCGHLKPDAMYLRSDVSKDGILPAFVLFKNPIAYNEPHFRGYVRVNGLQWEQAAHPETIYPQEIHAQAATQGYSDYNDLYEKRWDKATGGSEPPATELARHIARLSLAASGFGKPKKDIGHSEELWASDLLMWVGKDFYPTPKAFIDEGLRYGFNKRIRANGTPPEILSGRTKLYLAHPACPTQDGKGAPAVFGFTYLSTVLYTIEPGDALPKYVEDLVALSKIEAVYIGPQDLPGAQPAPLLRNTQ